MLADAIVNRSRQNSRTCVVPGTGDDLFHAYNEHGSWLPGIEYSIGDYLWEHYAR